MVRQIEHNFNMYEFDSDEERDFATVYTDLQRKALQNELAIASTKLLQIVIDPTKPLAAAFEHAYLRGQVDILKFILGISDARVSELQELLAEKLRNNADNN